MCGSKPKVDTSVQDAMLEETRLARQREEERQARIDQGTQDINNTFASFNDGYYNNIRDTYMQAQQPELDRQFKNATDQLTFALARAGTLNSSMAGKQQANLTSDYNYNLASMLSQAQAAADQQRAQVGQEKSSLVSLLNQTGNADMASNEALARTQQLYNVRPSYNPIGDVFGNVASSVGQYMNLQNNRAIYDNYFGGGGGSSRSSSRVIGG